jgi:deoxyadenosine/deoxycytidine kinase
MTPCIVSFDGNIGSGKSTLVSYLDKYFKDNDEIYFLQEPVDIWNTICDKNGTTILEKYYEDQHKYAFSFQMMAYISRLSILRNAFKNKNYKIIITERSVFTDKNVFAKMLYDEGKIEEIEYQIYLRWFDEFIDEFPEFKTIYLKTDPKIAKERVNKRGRQGENIPLAYLENCHQYHEDWLSSYRTSNSENESKFLEIDGNVDMDMDMDCTKNPEIINEWINKIKSFISI